MSGMTRDRAIEILRDDANHATLWEIAKAVDMAIDALKEQRPHGEWIPLHFDSESKCVSDFPNEMDGKLVIVTNGKIVSVERIKKDAYDHFFPCGTFFELEDVVAWMPLPEPYKKEGEAE